MLSSKGLAAKRGCQPQTARERTRSDGFPEAVELGPRSLRWYLDEVLAWETDKRCRLGRVVTGSRPQHYVDVDPSAFTLRTTRTVRQVA